MAVGGLEFSIMPLFLGGMVTHLLFSEQQVGFIGSAYLIGFTLTSFSAVFWSHRVNWRSAILIAALVAFLCYGIATVIGGFWMILLLVFGVGCARGAFYATSICTLGDREKAERAFALGSVATMVLAGLGMLALPYVMQEWLIYGLFVPLIAVTVMAAIMVRWLPVRAKERAESTQRTQSGKTLQVFLGLLALLIFWIGMCGVWAFLERIGNASGLSPQAIGTVLAVSYVAVILGALVAAWLGDRIGRAIPILVGMALMLAGILVMDRMLTFAMYMSASVLFQTGWIFCYPYMMAVINKSDASGRFVPLIAAAQGLGASVGSGLGGSLLATSEGYSALYRMGILSLLVSLVLFGWVLFKQRTEAAHEVA
jgi:predicted MFS family arabinose efflux permease